MHLVSAKGQAVPSAFVPPPSKQAALLNYCLAYQALKLAIQASPTVRMELAHAYTDELLLRINKESGVPESSPAECTGSIPRAGRGCLSLDAHAQAETTVLLDGSHMIARHEFDCLWP